VRASAKEGPPQPVSQHPVRPSTWHVRPRRPQGGFGGSPPESPRATQPASAAEPRDPRARFARAPSSPLACPLLPQKSSGSSGSSSNTSWCSRSLRSLPFQPEILPATAAEEQLRLGWLASVGVGRWHAAAARSFLRSLRSHGALRTSSRMTSSALPATQRVVVPSCPFKSEFSLAFSMAGSAMSTPTTMSHAPLLMHVRPMLPVPQHTSNSSVLPGVCVLLGGRTGGRWEGGGRGGGDAPSRTPSSPRSPRTSTARRPPTSSPGRRSRATP
jgi:hypothetical protein